MPTDAELEEAELLRLIQSSEAEWEQTKLFRLYPDTGPLRRELYKKHIRHFAAGREYSERALVGGNRCLTLATPVETDRGERRISEIVGETDFGVVALVDGSPQSVRAGPVFLKGIEPAFRLHLDNKEVFECSGRHRVLTSEGWLSLGQLIRRADGQHWFDEGSDYQASYGTGNRPGGLEPHGSQDSDRAGPPSADGAHRPVHSAGNEGGRERTPGYSRAYRGDGRLSIPGSPLGNGGQFWKSEHDSLGAIARLPVQRWSGSPQASLLLRPASTPLPTDGSQRHYRGHNPSLCGEGNELPDAPNTSSRMTLRGPVGLRPVASSALGLVTLEWLHAAPHKAKFYPSKHPSLVGGNRILMIEGIGGKQIVDFEVPGPHNYRAGGVIHHNSGKTMACSYETTCHLIGWYAPWWEGFRFDRPIVAWASGEDTKAVRESLQFTFLGAIDHFGTGLIPKRNILGTTARSGVPEAIDAVTIKSNNGGVSRLLFKAYDQGRESFQAAAVDVMQFDEEPPANIYGEGLTRVLSTVPGQPNGLVICGFTPLKGLSEVVLSYMPGGTMAEGAVT